MEISHGNLGSLLNTTIEGRHPQSANYNCFINTER